jgi:hypothetical protein
MCYSNGDVYTGQWMNDMMHGEGVMKYASGAVFSGLWVKDKINGLCGEWRGGEKYFPV